MSTFAVAAAAQELVCQPADDPGDLGLPPAVGGLVVGGSVDDAEDGGVVVELLDEFDEEVEEGVEVGLLGDGVWKFGLGLGLALGGGFVVACCVIVV